MTPNLKSKTQKAFLISAETLDIKSMKGHLVIVLSEGVCWVIVCVPFLCHDEHIVLEIKKS
jgi:hypothetical protein